MSISNSYPTQRPSLNLVFNGGSDQLDSRISYSRSSTATAFSSERHLSSENLLLDSKAGTANWDEAASGSASVPTITENYAAAPDGTASQATRVQLNLSGATDAGSNSRYNQTQAITSGTVATFSVWLKSTDGASSYAIQIYKANGNVDAATVTGSWQKFTTSASSVGGAAYGIRIRGGQTPTNADTADILIWGANLSTTGQTVLSETTSQIHREYSSTLKSYSSDQPRFEYSAADGQSEGLLIEAQSSNLWTYSDAFSNAAWTKTNLTASAEAISPDGSLNAFAIRENDGGGAKRIHQLAVTVAAGSVAVSVYAKMLGNERRLVIREDSVTGDSAVFDLSSGTVAATNVGGAGLIEAAGGGWYRCTLITSPTGSPGYQFGFWLATATGTNYETYTGDGYSGVLLFGAMCENASAPSSYIESLGSSTTRASDSCSLVSAPLLDNGSGGLVTEYDMQNASDTSYVLHAERSTGATNGGGVAVTNRYLIVENTYGVMGVTTSNVFHKVAASWESGSQKASRDGGAIVEDTATVVPSNVNTLHIGTRQDGNEAVNGHIRNIAIYSEPLSSTNLTTLSQL